MNLTYTEIKTLKGKTLREKSTGAVYKVDSVNSRYVRIGGGMKFLTSVFIESGQFKFELAANA